ncbi:cbb3-type cytochrome oxidase maturation protein [Thiogranum longum]|uniref:Cbb3-type cytochrome oxidase maturation protein n=1 Tax=Thiogranum longum TaxID=1537524 RepID=A0A4R1H9A0_9GAMM|nr:cbb3-type cytochrome oxidase maturation protein [Thiogranum longum]
MRCDCGKVEAFNVNILFLLIPVSLIIMGIAIWVFLWAIRSGQFEDLEGPAHRILMDDDDPRIPRKPQLKDDDE